MSNLKKLICSARPGHEPYFTKEAKTYLKQPDSYRRDLSYRPRT